MKQLKRDLQAVSKSLKQLTLKTEKIYRVILWLDYYFIPQ